MPGTQKKRPSIADSRTKAVGGQERIELTDMFGIDGGEPLAIELRGTPYDIRRTFTGEEVLEFGRLSAPIDNGKDEAGLPVPITERQIYDQRVAQLDFLLTEGDAQALHATLLEMPFKAYKRIIDHLLTSSGLINAEGEYLASSPPS